MDSLRLSEAMRLGSMVVPQGFGIAYRRPGTACALDAASIAGGLGANWEGTNEQLLAFQSYLPKIHTSCPECGPLVLKNPAILDGAKISTLTMVVHLNDQHEWSRERIADWVATVEAQQEPAQPTPELAEVCE